jgi:uncharacterized protein (TIGR01777 family)
MKVAVAGYSGLIGRHLTKSLKDKGFEVVEIPHRGDDLILDERHFDVDAVINLSGLNIMHRWSMAFKEEALSSRAGTATQINHFYDDKPKKPKVFISASAIGYYGDRPDEQLIETSPKGLGFLSDLVEKWEKATFNSPIHRIVVFRLGVVLSQDGGAVPKMAKAIKRHLGAILGNPLSIVSWIHIDDVVKAMIEALDRSSFSGIYNLVTDHPVSQRQFMDELAACFNKKIYLKLPAFLVKLVLGDAASILLNSAKVYPKKLKQSDFVFLYPEIQSALYSLKRRGL